MVGAGIALGVAGALGASRLMGSALYGVSPTDPLAVRIVASRSRAGDASRLPPAWQRPPTVTLHAAEISFG